MRACPHCGERTIGWWTEAWATRAQPATCGRCKGLSYPQRKPMGALAMHAHLLALFVGVPVAMFTLPWGLPLLVAVLLLAPAYELHRFVSAPLLPIDHATVLEEGRWQRVGYGFVTALLLGCGAYLALIS